eukprot:7237215-Prymnesium_polylepis.1
MATRRRFEPFLKNDLQPLGKAVHPSPAPPMEGWESPMEGWGFPMGPRGKGGFSPWEGGLFPMG